MAHVLDDGQTSNKFPVGNGEKQGCVLAPTLFSLMFSAMLTDVFTEDDLGLDVRYRMDVKIFNLRWLKAQTKVSHTKIRDLLFEDYCVLNAIYEEQAQRIMDNFSMVCVTP
jgi:hypothetical protein